MTNASRVLMIVLVSLFWLSNLLGPRASAQAFVAMNDEQYIELALDMIRKGVQRQDTTRTLMYFADEVASADARMESRGQLTARLQNVFGAATSRTFTLQRPVSGRGENPLNSSGFWDFDIIEPIITINGDTALVDCELVLWAAPAAAGQSGRGRRVKERFLFVALDNVPDPASPSPGPGNLQTEEFAFEGAQGSFDASMLNDATSWPGSPGSGSGQLTFKNWALVQQDHMFAFLEEAVPPVTRTAAETEGAKE